jgi:hypothetical protein
MIGQSRFRGNACSLILPSIAHRGLKKSTIAAPSPIRSRAASTAAVARSAIRQDESLAAAALNFSETN